MLPPESVGVVAVRSVLLAGELLLRCYRAMLRRREVGVSERDSRPVLLLFGVNISLLFHTVTLWLIILSLAS
jgi:hypothetical protein